MMTKSNQTHNRISKKKKYLIKTIIPVVAVVLFVVVSLLQYLGKFPSWDELYSLTSADSNLISDDSMSVHFIDVGQGDCSFIKTDSGSILIDAGERGNEKTVINYITELGVDTIDYVIATHPHSDHIGSLDDVIDAFTVKNVIMPKLTKSNTPTTAVYEDFLNSVKRSGAKVHAAAIGNQYSVDGMEMTVLSPIEQSDDLNDMSVVISIIYGDTSFLFMGDAEIPAENLILDSEYADYLDSDVLKAGHHGSSTSTSERFLQKVSPELVVITCGKDNDYGHPHRETVKLLNDYGIETRRTDKDGTVTLYSNGDSFTVLN